MRQWLGRRLRRFFFLTVLLLALAAGTAYATIPDSNGGYTACMQKDNGSIRLIDPSLAPKNKLGECKPNETEATWNKAG